MTFGSYGTTPAEMLEREYPLMVEGFGYVPDSGGPGKHRGSLSVYRQWRFLQSGTIMVRTNRPSRPSEGLAGGQPGALSQNVLNPELDATALPRQTHLHLEVKAGDRVFHSISGSGGHGDPWERDPADVQRDVRDEKVTVEAAREQYGVVLDSQALAVDWEKTTRLRQSRQETGQQAAVR